MVWYQYLKTKELQTSFFGTGEKRNSCASSLYNVRSLVILSIQTRLPNKIISPRVCSWRTPQLQTKLQPSGQHTVPGQPPPVVRAKLPYALPQPWPRPLQKHGTGSNSADTAVWICNLGNVLLCNRKRAHNKYTQNHSIFIVFGHPWELFKSLVQEITGWYDKKRSQLNIPSSFPAKPRTLRLGQIQT